MSNKTAARNTQPSVVAEASSEPVEAPPDSKTPLEGPAPEAPSVETEAARVPERGLREEQALFHVVGPGSIQIGGRLVRPGTQLELSRDEAEELGAAIRPGKVPPSPTRVERRGAGFFRVRGPGAVLHGGKVQAPGTLLDLSREDARSLGPAVEEAD